MRARNAREFFFSEQRMMGIVGIKQRDGRPNAHGLGLNNPGSEIPLLLRATATAVMRMINQSPHALLSPQSPAR